MAMTWTYDNPATDPKDAVRLKIGDTDSTDPQLFDEEINALLAESGSVLATAIACARALAGKYARQMNKAVGPFKIDAGARFEHYIGLAAELESQLGISGAAAFAGGISVSDKQDRAADTDRVQPAFTRSLGDFSDSSSDADSELS